MCLLAELKKLKSWNLKTFAQLGQREARQANNN